MSWYKQILTKNKKEIITSAIISIVITSAFSVWYFITSKGFEWREINPISQPSLLNRYFYSALVFTTIGAFLFYIVKLWKGLYFVFVELLRSRGLYELIKGLLWTSLILITYFYITPVVVDILNTIISFFYNIAILTLYLFPPLGISLLIFSAIFFIKKK